MSRCRHRNFDYINVDHPTMCIKYCKSCGALQYSFNNMKNYWVLPTNSKILKCASIYCKGGHHWVDHNELDHRDCGSSHTWNSM